MAQDTGKVQDEALDSLLEKLEKAGEEHQAGRTQTPRSKKRHHPEPQAGPTGRQAKAGYRLPARGQGANPTRQAEKSTKSTKGAKTGSGEVSSQDKDLDALLEKLGETKEEAAPEERRSHPQPGEPSGPTRPAPAGGGGSEEKTKSKDQGLQGKDKEIDDRLEEFAGKKRKKKGGQPEEGSGPLGEIVKEMRDVEQRLSKPETGEDTQSRQKRIVKNIDTLIQQMKQSGSSSSMAMRRIRQQGQKPGDQPGQNSGANAAGRTPDKAGQTLGPARHGGWQGHLGPPSRRTAAGDD